MKKYFLFYCLLYSLIVSAQVKLQPATYRPEFHFAPNKNWINDPNGLVYKKGIYHMYFQYNPFADVWGHMSWGHATSKDLIHWQEQPVAITEYDNPDSSVTSIFSGTAIIDSTNTSGVPVKPGEMPMIAVYTGNVTKGEQLAQYQSMAYSLDDGMSFTQYHKNPVLSINSKEFRDPKIFWDAPSQKWIMIVSKPNQYKLHFYSSSDLIKWDFLSEFGGSIGNRTKVWECPDIFELPVTNEPGKKKWVITLSAGHKQEGFLAMQYFIGGFDGIRFTADSLDYPLYLDHGKDFYAGITYNDMPANDSRRIMISWANCWEYANKIPSQGYRGEMAIPRTLTLVKDPANNYTLYQNPVAELNKYRSELLFERSELKVDTKTNNLNGVKGDALDIEFTMSRMGAGTAGIKVLKNGNEETLIYYNSADNTVKLDRNHSGQTGFSERFPGTESAPLIANAGNIKFRILIDHSLVEVFINDGAAAITDLVFPNAADGGVEFFSSGGNTAVFKNIKIWKMKGHVK